MGKLKVFKHGNWNYETSPSGLEFKIVVLLRSWFWSHSCLNLQSIFQLFGLENHITWPIAPKTCKMILSFILNPSFELQVSTFDRFEVMSIPLSGTSKTANLKTATFYFIHLHHIFKHRKKQTVRIAEVLKNSLCIRTLNEASYFLGFPRRFASEVPLSLFFLWEILRISVDRLCIKWLTCEFFSVFSVGDASSNYILQVRGYSGNANAEGLLIIAVF